MMKKINWLFLLASFTLHAQSGSYQSLWKDVSRYENQNLLRSAKQTVEKIYDKAEKEHNTNQLIKAFIYRSKYMMTIEENAELKVITDLQKEIQRASVPAKNMLENILANLYWQYYQSHSYKFYKRTETAEKVNPEDFRTWDLATLFAEITKHFDRSLQSGLILQQTPLDRFDTLIETNKITPEYYPSLFDFFARDAVLFYKNSQSNLPQPEIQFEIDKPAYLGTNENFIRQHFTSPDSLALKRKALDVYRSLTRYLMADDAHIPALIHLTLERMDFVRENAVFSDKDEIYLKELKKMEKKYLDRPEGTLISYRIAQEYKRLGDLNQTKEDDISKTYYPKAVAVCNDALMRFPDSDGANACRDLLNNIRKPEIQFTSEKFILPGRKSRLFVRYKNSGKSYVRIYKANKRFVRSLREVYDKKAKFKKIINLPLVRSVHFSLTDPVDYRYHTTECILPDLDQGIYVILSSPDPEFAGTEMFAYGVIQATGIAMNTETDAGDNYFRITDRNTGEPLQNAKVHIYNSTNKNNPYVKKINKYFTTDAHGYFKFNPGNYYPDVYMEVDYGDRHALFGPEYLNRIYGGNHRPYHENRIFLFTDRSIYRPGQILYFKGIALDMKENRSTVLENLPVKISLTDVNFQEVATLTLNTNEYGSFHGNFIIPDTGLKGRYQLRAQSMGKLRFSNRQAVQVEEYKRPTFTVAFDSITKEYRLGDSIRIKGRAEAYSGAHIENARVKYVVVREVRFPKWYYFYRYFRPGFIRGEAQQIKKGITYTHSDGSFDITFPALPDRKIPEKDLPVFTYSIQAEVTDINGETRNRKTRVSVGYHSLNLDTEFPQEISDNDKPELTIRATNLNGAEVPVSGQISLSRLQEPGRVLRPALWEKPEYPPLSEKEFKTLFPHDAYGDEGNMYKWKKGQSVWDKEFTARGMLTLKLNKIKHLKAGVYLIETRVKDKNGKEVVSKNYFKLTSGKKQVFAVPEILTLHTDKTEYRPGETVHVQLGSAACDTRVVVNIQKDNRHTDRKFFVLDKEKNYLDIPVTEENYGGINIQAYTVKYNAIIKKSVFVQVPYPKTELQIETNTFRDKISPDSEEKWSFVIRGPKGEKVAAEVLASMYDMSLDQFIPHRWNFSPVYHSSLTSRIRVHSDNFSVSDFISYLSPLQPIYNPRSPVMSFRWFGLSFGGYGQVMYDMAYRGRKTKGIGITNEVPVAMEMEVEEEVSEPMDVEQQAKEAVPEAQEEEKSASSFDFVHARRNMKETAFFFPQLHTDAQGGIHLEFTTPESLTRWKLMLLAHTQDLKSAVKTFETVSAKELMLTPNPPRFLREGDSIVFRTKISNLSGKNLSGQAVLELQDALTGKDIAKKLIDGDTTQHFEVAAQSNVSVAWKLFVPYDVQAVQYTVKAIAGDFSDGEQNFLPVLSNRMLVTETLPMWVNGGHTKTFVFDKLKNNHSATLKHHALTLEVTSQPAWYAVQALPYLMEYPYECSEQTFARLYANTLGSYIVHSNPKIETVLNQWKSSGALISNLEKNKELKSIILKNTPWIRDARSETEQKKRIALLFDLQQLKNERKKSLHKLKDMQFSDGGFPWFKGARYPNRYITQHIVSGFGHLARLTGNSLEADYRRMLGKAIDYTDRKIIEDYDRLMHQADRIAASGKNKTEKEKLKNNYLDKYRTTDFQIHYLYGRSFFPEKKIQGKLQKVTDFYLEHAYKSPHDYALYTKAMLTLVAYRNGRKDIARALIEDFKQTAVYNEEMGMYWKANTSGYSWNQAPIETQALIIEAFTETAGDNETVDKLKIWLLKNKQTNRWKTTKATTEAVYALLLNGTDWISSNEFVDVKVGNTDIDPLKDPETKVEAGTGYFKKHWYPGEITPEMGNVSITKKDKGIAWGAMYWQYFEDLDKITAAETPLSLHKKVFKVIRTNRSEQLVALNEGGALQVGDLVRIRIELKSDRDMEFIHMKDMRGAGFEPVDVISRYRWQDGLGYYQSTGDAATDFFFDRLPKGIYVFEYDLRVNNAGVFSNGISLIESMYAPEFASHSKGEIIRVK